MELRYITVEGAKLLLASSGTPKHLCTTCCACVPEILLSVSYSVGVTYDMSSPVNWMGAGVADPGVHNGWRIIVVGEGVISGGNPVTGKAEGPIGEDGSLTYLQQWVVIYGDGVFQLQLGCSGDIWP